MAKTFTRKVEGMDGMDYVQRLQALRLYSQERRRERYQIIFLWKVGMGMVKGYSVPFTLNPRTGWHITPAKIPPVSQAPASVRKAREASLAHKGTMLFNSMPKGLRGMMTNHVDEFKCNLVSWIFEHP